MHNVLIIIAFVVKSPVLKKHILRNSTVLSRAFQLLAPDLPGERPDEGEQLALRLGRRQQDGCALLVERGREVDPLLSDMADGEPRHSHVYLLSAGNR